MRMMVTEPLVSAIIPVYNGERYLAEAIESAIGQTYRPVEVIVVDDGSTDGSAEVARRFGDAMCYHSQVHSGMAVALNHGVELALGDFLAFLDADDVWMRDKLALQVSCFAENPSLDMVFGHAEEFDSPELMGRETRATHRTGRIIPGYSHGTMLIKRDVFLMVGYFATQWRVGQFLDWYARASEIGLNSLLLPDVLLRRRLHLTNLGIIERDARGDYARILKAALDRRRRGGSCGGPCCSEARDTSNSDCV